MEVDLKVILSIVGSFFGAYFWLYNNTKINLQQKLYRDKKVKLLESHTFEEKYKTNLQYLINWLENIYNNSTLIQNYSRHIMIALLYSFMVFLIFWVLGAEGKIGSVEILKETTTLNKLKALAFFVFYISLIHLIYNNFTKLVEFIIKKLPKDLQKNNIIRMIITLGVGVAGVIVVIVLIIGGGEEEIVVVEGSLGATIIITLFSVPSIFLMKRIGLGLSLIIMGLILTGMILSRNSNNTDIYIISLFLALLPLTNSLLDYISLKISKYMSEQIMQDNTILTVLLHLLADLIIAIILLLSLALFLHFSVELLNMFLDEPIPMKEMLIATWNDPFSVKNGWITFMLFSTLLPTFVHLVLALGALFIAIMPSEQSLKELKMYNKGQEALLESSAHYFTRIAFMQTFFSFVILILLSLPFWYEKLR